ncbi:DUF1345 domain-containing protein [Gryllotalpicola reticulitermitis]|uniref:DUF1345 domain-containing protein n=1 Tax=Gryllotalpicola reticulitermitis TaxID=1184153 RepID=A0ABV8Q5U9_9MICO
MSATNKEQPSSLAARRVSVMLAVGAVAAVIAGFTISWWYAGAIGWIIACATYILWVWIHLWPLDSDGVRAHATREDPGIVVGDLLVLSASVASLTAVALVLVRASSESGWRAAGISGIAMLSLALSWFLIHTLYAQRYAREYYAHPEGGIDFPSDDDADPIFSDFAYLAFDLGQTYQVSDTTLRSTKLRRVVLRHTLLSYLFGTVILASAINVVVGLGSGGGGS